MEERQAGHTCIIGYRCAVLGSRLCNALDEKGRWSRVAGYIQARASVESSRGTLRQAHVAQNVMFAAEWCFNARKAGQQGQPRHLSSTSMDCLQEHRLESEQTWRHRRSRDASFRHCGGKAAKGQSAAGGEGHRSSTTEARWRCRYGRVPLPNRFGGLAASPCLMVAIVAVAFLMTVNFIQEIRSKSDVPTVSSWPGMSGWPGDPPPSAPSLPPALAGVCSERQSPPPRRTMPMSLKLWYEHQTADADKRNTPRAHLSTPFGIDYVTCFKPCGRSRGKTASKANLTRKKGTWTPDEDAILREYARQAGPKPMKCKRQRSRVEEKVAQKDHSPITLHQPPASPGSSACNSATASAAGEGVINRPDARKLVYAPKNECSKRPLSPGGVCDAEAHAVFEKVASWANSEAVLPCPMPKLLSWSQDLSIFYMPSPSGPELTTSQPQSMNRQRGTRSTSRSHDRSAADDEGTTESVRALLDSIFAERTSTGDSPSVDHMRSSLSGCAFGIAINNWFANGVRRRASPSFLLACFHCAVVLTGDVQQCHLMRAGFAFRAAHEKSQAY
eukprot:SM000006S19419  [mRNA]  locus=s6:594699:602170:+ [translate_table: standard]